MKKIFIVEDDAVVVEIYRKKFQQEGYEVGVAEDGLVAMKQLPLAKPDLVVLDLMMPKFTGADVLKFIRAHPDLKHIKVVIFSNAYMTDLAQEAAKAGADCSLLKSSCTPRLLINVVKELLDGTSDTAFLKKAAALAAPAPAVPPPRYETPAPAAPLRPMNAPQPETALGAEERARRDLIESGPATLRVIRDLFNSFAERREPQFQQLRLLDFHRKVHFLTGVASMARCNRIAHLASALEAMLFELQERPKFINASSIQTIRNAIDFLEVLFEHAHLEDKQPPLPANILAVLVVDDDAIANRTLVHALSRAEINPTSTDNPFTALRLLQDHRYDLLLLDYLMPGMDGLELYHRVRHMPQYKDTPVIFVTGQVDFQDSAQAILSRGDDVITKPIFPIELAVKALTLLMRSKLAEELAAPPPPPPSP